jgi:hypothetical protein
MTALATWLDLSLRSTEAFVLSLDRLVAVHIAIDGTQEFTSPDQNSMQVAFHQHVSQLC